MRTSALLFFSVVLLALPASADEEVSVQRLVTNVNTAARPEIWFELVVDKPIDILASTEKWRDINASLRDAESLELLAELEMGANDTSISFKTSDLSADLPRRIFKGERPVYIDLSSDLPVIMEDGTTALLTPAKVKEISAQISLSEGRLTALEDVARGRQRIYENRLELAREVGEDDSLTAQYALSYQLSQAIERTPLVIEATGRLSTDEVNPLNRIEFSLLGRTGVSRFDLGAPVFWSAYLSGNVFGNQTFDAAAATFELGADALLPNFVNLTAGANRLRLKPVVGVSLGYRRQFEGEELFDGKQDLFEIGYKAAYLIPVLTKYTLTLDSEGSYNEKAKGEAFFHATALALYYDLPPEELKVLAKWEIGRNEFSFEQDSRVLLGIIADFLPF